MYDIYSSAKNDSWRYTLGKSGSRQLLVVGLNPSTATRERSDTTVAKVERVAQLHGFDGFVMLNLYPVRATDFNELPFAVDRRAYAENLRRIDALVASNPASTVWAAWGESVRARSYFIAAARDLLSRLKEKGTNCQHFGTLTLSGHPRHPSRLNYEWSFEILDVVNYLRVLPAQ